MREKRLVLRMQALGVAECDLAMTFCRSSGPGGQHVNKVSTAVEVVHLPTGSRAACSSERSQRANRLLALSRLLDRIEETRRSQLLARKAETAKRRRQQARRSKAGKARIAASKKHRSETKKLRARVST